MPVPTLVRLPVPEMMPEKVVLVLLAPADRAALPSVTEPAPASDPIDWLKLARASVAPAATVVALFDPKALAIPARKVPALTVVAPV